MIIHSPIISGSLTFADGATFTLPDNGEYSGSFSGSIQVHELQSHVIPNSSASYDLGSADFPFRDLYLSAETLKLGGLKLGGLGGKLSIKDSNNETADIEAKSLTIGGLSGNTIKLGLGAAGKVSLLDENEDEAQLEVSKIILKDTSGAGRNTILTNDAGKFTTQEADNSGTITALDSEGSLSGSFTGSIQDAEFNGDATFNDNVSITGTIGLPMFSLTIGSTVVSTTAAELNLLGTAAAGTVVNSKGVIYGEAGEVNATKLQVGGVDITATPAELNLLDGVSGLVKADFTKLAATDATAAELNLLDGSTAGTVVNSKGVVYGSGGEVNATKLQVGGVDITASPAELNLLDDVSGLVKADFTKLAATDATATELNILSGTTAVTADLDKLASVTSTAAELNLLDDVSGLVKADFTKLAATDATAAELNILSGTTAVTADLDKLASVTASSDELNFVDGVTSNIQTQFGRISLALNTNTLSLTKADNTTDDIDLSAYLDEDSRAISSGTMAAETGIVTFTRDDATTFTLDLSALLDDTNLVTSVAGKAGVVTLVKGDVGLANVDNTSDADKPVSTAQATAIALKAPIASPTFTGTVSGVTKAHVGLGNVDNTSDADKPVSTAQATAIALKAPIASPTFTGTVSGVTKAHVGLGNVDNTSDADKPVSTATQLALNAKQATISGGTGVTVSSNTVSIGQSVGTGDSVTFASVAGGTITGTSVSVTGDVVAYSSSDSRLKDNVKNIENAIEKVQSLNGVTWDWNDNADELQKSIPNVGVIAQEVEQVLPQLVKDRENGYKGVDYAKLTGLLIEAIKEQQVQIDELKSKLN